MNKLAVRKRYEGTVLLVFTKGKKRGASMIRKIFKTHRIITLCCAFAVFLFPYSNAGANTFSHNSAYIDLDTLTLSFSGFTTFNMLGESVGGLAVARNETEYDSALGTTVSVFVPDAYAQAGRSDSYLYSSATADSSTWASALAYVYLRRDFYVVGDGTITVTADYSLQQELGTDRVGDYAGGLAYASLELYGSGHSFDADVAYLRNEVFDGDTFFGNLSGTLSVSLDNISFPDGANFSLRADVGSRANVVPEPATMLLFGVGLAGLAFRKKQRS